MYKLYSSVLNNRLYKWVEDNDKVVDEQNGFRKHRSTVDHLSSFTNLVDTRKRLNQSTFCAFIDLKMAYDFVDRDILWNKLKHIGINGPILNAFKSLYSSVSSLFVSMATSPTGLTLRQVYVRDVQARRPYSTSSSTTWPWK